MGQARTVDPLGIRFDGDIIDPTLKHGGGRRPVVVIVELNCANGFPCRNTPEFYAHVIPLIRIEHFTDSLAKSGRRDFIGIERLQPGQARAIRDRRFTAV